MRLTSVIPVHADRLRDFHESSTVTFLLIDHNLLDTSLQATRLIGTERRPQPIVSLFAVAGEYSNADLRWDADWGR